MQVFKIENKVNFETGNLEFEVSKPDGSNFDFVTPNACGVWLTSLTGAAEFVNEYHKQEGGE